MWNVVSGTWILNEQELGVSYLMEMARSHERREDSGRSKEEFQEVLVVCNELMINIASREEAMIQSLCVPYIAGKAQRLTGQSLGLGDFTLFPSSRFCPKGFSLVRFLMRKFFKVPSLT